MGKQARWYAEQALKRGKKIDSNVLWSFLADDQHAREHTYKLLNNFWSWFVNCVKNIIDYFWWDNLKRTILIWVFIWAIFWTYKYTSNLNASLIMPEILKPEIVKSDEIKSNDIIASTGELIYQSWTIEKVVTSQTLPMTSWDNFFLTWN